MSLNSNSICKTLSIVLLGIGIAQGCFAGIPIAPEISPAMGSSAIALLGGALLVFRSRRK